MLRLIYCFVIVFAAGVCLFAQQKTLTGYSTTDEKSEINFQNQIPTGQAPADLSSLIPGSLMLGVLADVSFPFGEDFKKYAGTGFSGHLFAGYSILNTLMITLKAGYIKFGEEEVDFGLDKISQEEFSATQTNSQVPLLLGLFYTPGLDPTCLGAAGSCLSGGLISPFIGLQFGPFFKTYTYKSEYNYQYFGKVSETAEVIESSESSTIFGLVPTIGTFYSLSENIRLVGSVEYNYLFEEADVDAANISFLSINLGAAYKIL
jgi:hypothetical protein